MECTNSASTGEITTATTLGKVIIKFTGCKVEGGGRSCELNSSGAKKGEIITKALIGELGSVATKEAASGVGLLLQVEEHGGYWAQLVLTTCLGETKLTGSMAGEIGSVGVKQLTNTLVFATTSAKQDIKHIKVKSGEVEPALMGWGIGKLIYEGHDELTFEEALEVT